MRERRRRGINEKKMNKFLGRRSFVVRFFDDLQDVFVGEHVRETNALWIVFDWRAPDIGTTNKTKQKKHYFYIKKLDRVDIRSVHTSENSCANSCEYYCRRLAPRSVDRSWLSARCSLEFDPLVSYNYAIITLFLIIVFRIVFSISRRKKEEKRKRKPSL